MFEKIKLRMSNFFLSIEDLEKKLAMEFSDADLKDKRSRTNILVVDNEKPKIISQLSAQGFNVHHKDDIESLHDIRDNFDIFIIDVLGVGHKLSEESEGAYLASLIKNDYPYKPVYVFTGSNQDRKYNQYYKKIDGIYAKNQAEEVISQIDNHVRSSHSAVIQWYKYRMELNKIKCPIKFITYFEHYYVKSQIRKKKKYFEKAVNIFIKDKLYESDEIANILKNVTELIVKRVIKI